MTYAPNPEPGAAETRAHHTATAIMAILHDAVLNPGPGGLVQVKARIQVAVREAIKSMAPDVPQSVTVSAAGNLRVGQDDLVLVNASLAQQNASLARQNGDLAERNNALLAEHDRLAVENTSLQGKLHDLQHDIEAQRAKNGELAREASNYRQEAAANAQRRDEARADLAQAREELHEFEDLVLMFQDFLDVARPSEDSPIADHGDIVKALHQQRGRLSATQQADLLNLCQNWMPPKGFTQLKNWLINQPREA